jgi:hypothetical protein
MMTTPKIDPSRIFLQADGFYQALAILCNVEPDNTQLAVILNEPMMVIGALTIELFLKCLSCIETGQVPRTHHLRELYDGLSPAIRARIEHTWDNEIVVHRATEWDHFEKSVGTKMDRDLPSALEVASISSIQSRYPVLDRVACGKDQNGNAVMRGSQFCEQVQAVAIGQTEIENRGVIDGDRERLSSVVAPVHHIHCKSGALQSGLQYLRNPRLVFYDQ